MSDSRPNSPDKPCYVSSKMMPFPNGHYTVWPLIQACNNVTLPQGPFQASDCKLRWQRHQHERRFNSINQPTTDSSALADDDDDDDDDNPQDSETSFDNEFLCPFFVEMPQSTTQHYMNETHSTKSSHSNSNSRRSSLHRTSFSRMTPMPQLRSCSPTPSSPSIVQSSIEPSKQSQPIGFLRPKIVKALIEDNKKMVAMNCKPVWRTLPEIDYPPPARRPSYSQSRSHSRRNSSSTTPRTQPGTPSEHVSSSNSITGHSIQSEPKTLKDELEKLNCSDLEIEKQIFAISFQQWVNDEGQQSRTEHVDRVVRGWKMMGQFNDLLDGWRDEEYTIYGPRPETENPLPGSNQVFTMERSACALFGFTTFGVHLTAYIPQHINNKGEEIPLKIWVPKRSSTKQTWPGYLDNTVAGGISSGDSPFNSIVRECQEEASFDPKWSSKQIENKGVVIYNYRTNKGWLQPEVQYVYDLELPIDNSIQPKTNDSEVESFELMDLRQVVEKMLNKDFKPNCSLVLCDFLIRHGYINFESDVRFLDVAMGCRSHLSLPGPA
ncbi:hypothetical protein OIO90_004315 [Microbotryomycetes sp. JL221]|nr:hypothetical protein OIO90_004315 [Microbotryomycetes sp. JL221]